MATFSVAFLRIGTSFGNSTGSSKLLSLLPPAGAFATVSRALSLLPQPSENATSTISATAARLLTSDLEVPDGACRSMVDKLATNRVIQAIDIGTLLRAFALI